MIEIHKIIRDSLLPPANLEYCSLVSLIIIIVQVDGSILGIGMTTKLLLTTVSDLCTLNMPVELSTLPTECKTCEAF